MVHIYRRFFVVPVDFVFLPQFLMGFILNAPNSDCTIFHTASQTVFFENVLQNLLIKNTL